MRLHVIPLGSPGKHTLPSCLCLACLSIITKSQVLIQTLLLSASSKTITFYNRDTRGEIQKATFNQEEVKRIFHGSFHKVRARCACHIMMIFRCVMVYILFVTSRYLSSISEGCPAVRLGLVCNCVPSLVFSDHG